MSWTRARAAGITLVELLIAVGLTILIVGIVAGISIQVQRSIGLSTAREDAARVARTVMNDIERDLSHLLPKAKGPFADSLPPPTGGGTGTGAGSDRVLRFEDVPDTGGNPPGSRDRLTMLTTINDLDPASDATALAYVRYELAPRTTPPDGGPDVGNLHRLVSEEGGGAEDRILAGNVISMDIQWLNDPDGSDGPTAPSWQEPDADTASGDIFAHEGTVNVAQGSAISGTEVTPSGAGAQKLLENIPIGGELWLEKGGDEPIVRLLVRRRTGSGGSVKAYVNDRLEDLSGVNVSRFQGPPLLRVTLQFSFGKGPDAPTGRFTRNFTVPK